MAKFKQSRSPKGKLTAAKHRTNKTASITKKKLVTNNVNKSANTQKAKKGKRKSISELVTSVMKSTSNNKAVNLLKKPVTINPDEFEHNDMFEEMQIFKYISFTKKTGKPFAQDWIKENGKVKLSQPKIFNDFKQIELPNQTDLFGVEVPSNNCEDDENSNIPKKKKKKKLPKIKASYDKTPDDLKKVTHDTIDSDINITDSRYTPATPLDADTPATPSANTAHKQQKKLCVDVTAWDCLYVPEPIKKALSELGFSKPTKIQQLTIGSAIKDGYDILGAAETGSGKTLAFAIPMIAGILRDNSRRKIRQEQLNAVNELRQRTAESKRKRAEVMDSDDEESEEDGSMESNGEHDENGEFEETDDSDVEEHLFNGVDGVLDVDYSELDNSNKKVPKKKKKNGRAEAEESDSGHSFSSDDDVESFSDAEQDEIDINSEEESSNSNDSEDSAQEVDGNISDSDNSDKSDANDLGSSEEEDVESDDGQKMGCIRAINNVQFPFALAKKPKFVDNEDKPLLRALILTPTRELAVQIHSHISQLCRHTSLHCCVLVGGLDARKQRRLLQRIRPEIVVATPGRLWELVNEGLEHLTEMRGVRYLAIDEADRMIDRKNFQEVHKIVRLMNDGNTLNMAKSNRQTFIFSATLTLVHKLPDRIQDTHSKAAAPTSEMKLQRLARMVGTKPSAKVVDVTRKHATAENLTECRINCDLSEKDQYLYYFLQRHPGRTMVFCNSIEAVRRLKSIFMLLECDPQYLHASMHQKQRLRHLQLFSSRSQGLLITTDVAARGLDIPDVQHVVHFQVPFTAESYVHRSGRTARGTKCGLSVVLVEPKDVLRFRQICSTLGRSSASEIPVFPVDENLYEQVGERVQLAVSLEKLLHKNKREEQLKKERLEVRDNIGFRDSDDEIDQEDLYLMPASVQARYRSGGQKAELKFLRHRLAQLVKQPLLGTMFSFSHPMGRAALAAGIGADEDEVPDELVAMNPTKKVVRGEEEEYKQRFDKEIYGELVPEEDDGKMKSVTALLKKQRKDMAKLTRKLLKPEQAAKEFTKKNQEKKAEKQKKKADKKKEKRRKKRKLMNASCN